MTSRYFHIVWLSVVALVTLVVLVGLAAQQVTAMQDHSAWYQAGENSGEAFAPRLNDINHDDPSQPSVGTNISLPLLMKNFAALEGGVIVFQSTRDDTSGELYSMDYAGTHVTRLTQNSAVEDAPDWSPDGSKIAYSSDLTGEFEIYTMNADGSNQTQLTTMNRSYSPQWSPDGSKIAFYTRQDNNNIIYTMNPGGSGLFQVTDPAVSGSDPIWSPDGTKIAFYSTRLTPMGIYVIDADGTNQSLLLQGTSIASFAWSPDGSKLALSISAAPNYNMDLYLYDIASGITTRLTETTRNHNSVDWSPEGRYLIFHANLVDLSNFDVYRLSLDGRYLQNLTNNPAADAVADWGR